MSEKSIYALKDPISGAVGYVGQAENPERRYRQHLTRGAREMMLWVMGLEEHGSKPTLEILEVIDAEKAGKCERDWIRHLGNEGHPLINKNGPPNKSNGLYLTQPAVASSQEINRLVAMAEEGMRCAIAIVENERRLHRLEQTLADKLELGRLQGRIETLERGQ